MKRLLEATARAEADHFWFKGFRRFVLPLLRQATERVEAPQILDCGCGTGANLQLLSGFGVAVGFDLTPAGLAFAQKRGLRRIVRASVAAVPFGSSRFDLVTSFDVLYCLEPEDEAAAVREMFRVLRPGGHLVVNVAAMRILRGNHSVLSLERRRYSRPSLRVLLQSAGFEIQRLTYTNATLFPVLLGVRMLQRLAGLADEEGATGEITVPAAPINAVLSAALALEAGWLRHADLPVGSSLLCLARKPG